MSQSNIATSLGSFVFERYVICCDARQILVDGEPAKLGARAFDLLLVLIAHRDRVVSKNELLDLIWPGLVVEENNLQVHVSALRKLLGPQTISTIPGRGYRFTATLGAAKSTTAAPAPASEATSITQLTDGRPERRAPDRIREPPTLFGRDNDLAALTDLMRTNRLVTITGAGGIGKTALAQALTRTMAPAYSHGVGLVDLAPLTDAAQLAPTIASTLQVTLGGVEVDGNPCDRERNPDNTALALTEALADRHMLIVLDNCEHLIQPVAMLVSALLAKAPKLYFLATSQEPLKLQPEQIYRVATLDVPKITTLVEARQAGAVRLFENRAHAADARFVLTENNIAAVVDICAQLDGIALAIELAAARVQLLGVQGLRDRLGQRLFVLNGGSRVATPRHRTLRAALDWSHALLSAEQQAVFRRLGVMSGSFGLDASQRVAAFADIDEWAALDHLGALVEKSLVTVEANEAGEMRYRMLETMRQFALERLEESGEQTATRERHLRYFLALAEEAKPQLLGAAQGAWLDRLDRDRDNLFSAHAWCDQVPDGTLRGLKLVNALMRYWLSRGLLVQGHQAYLHALARPAIDGEAYQHLRCEGLLNAGWLCSYRGLDNDALRLLTEAIAHARTGGFNKLLANALARLGFVSLSLHDRGSARVHLEEAVTLSRLLADEPWLVGLALSSLAELERLEGHVDVAEALYEESLRHVRTTGDRLRTMIGLNNLAMVAVATGDVQHARERLIESLAISDELDSRRGRLVAMEVCAGLAAHLKLWELAARFDGAADTHTVQMGRRRDVADMAFLAPLVARARAALGADGYAAAQTGARILNYGDAVDAMRQWLMNNEDNSAVALNANSSQHAAQ